MAVGKAEITIQKAAPDAARPTRSEDCSRITEVVVRTTLARRGRRSRVSSAFCSAVSSTAFTRS